MMSPEQSVAQAYAIQRYTELQRLTEQGRLAHHGRADQPRPERVSFVRRAIGSALVRAGARLQGTPHPATTEVQPAA